jgi:hypothetical protein
MSKLCTFLTLHKSIARTTLCCAVSSQLSRPLISACVQQCVVYTVTGISSHKIWTQLQAHLFTDISSTFLLVAKWKQIFVQCKVPSSACKRMVFHMLCPLLMSQKEEENWITGVWAVLCWRAVSEPAVQLCAICTDFVWLKVWWVQLVSLLWWRVWVTWL